jgi:prevent-host-death family protein
MAWQLAEAKNRFSEIVDLAMNEGPQHVSKRGEPAVVIVSEVEFQKLKGQRRSLKDLILNGPDLTGVDLSRNQTPSREYEW